MAYLEITLKVDEANRPEAAGIYQKYKQPFLDTVPGAEQGPPGPRGGRPGPDGFADTNQAEAYLSSDLFTADVVVELAPLLAADPECVSTTSPDGAGRTGPFAG